MNPVQNALSKIIRKIPPEILQETFMPRRYDPSRRERYRDNQLGVSIESLIRREVIDGRVSVDVNLCSGVETIIPLQNCPKEVVDPYNVIFRIPKSITGQRNITTVYSVTYGVGNMMGSNAGMGYNSSPLMEAASGLFQAESGMSSVSGAYVTLIGDNTILVNDIIALPGMISLRCMLTHEPNMANLRPPYYKHYTELGVLATKAHIYNTQVINLDEGQIKAGSSLGRFREIVDSYADSDQLYEDYLKDTWRVVSTLNDPEKYRRILRMTVGGRR